MQRLVVEQSRVHEDAQRKLANNHRDIIEECEQAVRDNAVLVIGMAQNPFPKRAKKALDEKGTPYKYLEYGNYFGPWRRRTALKMWSGWPTFPMIFIKGTFVGGANELQELIKTGELDRMLAQPVAAQSATSS